MLLLRYYKQNPNICNIRIYIYMISSQKSKLRSVAYQSVELSLVHFPLWWFRSFHGLYLSYLFLVLFEGISRKGKFLSHNSVAEAAMLALSRLCSILALTTLCFLPTYIDALMDVAWWFVFFLDKTTIFH